MKRIYQRVRSWAIPAFLTLFAFALFRFIVFVGYVPTESMEPTLEAGSYICGTRCITNLEKGDVIVFTYKEQLLVKRIYACPGDEVNLCELKYMTNHPIPIWEDPILQIPTDSYFVLGDNTENSFDSRYWDNPFIHEEDIVAKIWIP